MDALFEDEDDIKKRIYSEPNYNKEFLNTKIESVSDEVTDKVPKVDSNLTCLAVISFYSALKKDEKYYPQVFLKDSQYIEKKVVRHITDDIEIPSDISDNSNDSDEG